MRPEAGRERGGAGRALQPLWKEAAEWGMRLGTRSLDADAHEDGMPYAASALLPTMQPAFLLQTAWAASGTINRMDDAIHPIRSAAVEGRLARLGRGLWPPRCLVCGERGANGRDLCRDCDRALPWNHCACPRCALPLPLPAAACGRCLKRPSALDAVRAAFVYSAPLDRLLPRLKFHDDLAAGRLLAALMLDDPKHPLAVPIPDDAREPPSTALIAVPLSRARLRQRGYDQARELARPLARALGLPLADGELRRLRDTPPQSNLGALARRRNLRGAFAAEFRAAPPARVLLVDDVMTTGATLHAAAAALRRAGVARVEAWVCARVP